MNMYDFVAIEAKWQRFWDEHKTFRSPGPGDPDFDPTRSKFYVLDMFPYPSGKGLHVGHPLGYIATDIVARFKRMTGHNVLHPMGFDAFGLPAEQYAVETGTHPRVTTEANIANMKRQLIACGLGYDWDREIATTDESYYRWTQWIFLQLFGSWFDPEHQAARPIGELILRLEADVVRLAGGELRVRDGNGFDEAPSWASLDPRQREDALGTQRLAYLDEVPVNWCPALGTVLANEEVTNDGRSERGNHPVFKRPLRQWMLRITRFADRLERDLEQVDWPESVASMQRNWIGRSEGARVSFPVVGHDAEIEIFTTCPDTLFGATYMVLAPEHALVDMVTTDAQRDAVRDYRRAAESRSDVDRQAETKEKTGVFTGGHAINPVNGEEIPIWIADYVLMGYGTGAIMAVPAHDTRDFAFAKTFSLHIRPVIVPDDAWLAEQDGARAVGDVRSAYLAGPATFDAAFTGHGTGINSANDTVSLDGMPTADAKEHMVRWLADTARGRAEVQYKLRDWLFSRQRYWGEPFPILHGPDGTMRVVDELPVRLPEIDDYRPQASDDPQAEPQTPLSRAGPAWTDVEIDGITYRREFNTMPQWAGSCWYYLRYLDPTNEDRFVGVEAERYWMSPRGVDVYLGGVEHAVLHLLYARFWHKVLFDLGHVSTHEPFGRLVNQGYIQAYYYEDARGIRVEATEVEEGPDGTFTHAGQPVTRSLGKMGKSLKNAVAPDDIFAEYGADTLRLYELYLGPLEQSKAWNTRAIVGAHRFLQRLWRNLVDENSGALLVSDEIGDEGVRRVLHQTIRDVTENFEDMRYNSAIARLIELNNALVPIERVPREVAEAFVLMLSPIAPHVCEELWQRMGHDDSIALASWPDHHNALLVEDAMDIVVQVMGKKRGLVSVPVGSDQETILAAAQADKAVARHLDGKTIRKVIYVEGKLLNVVAN